MGDSDTEELADPYSNLYNKKWEATPIRGFKSNRDYIYAMKEDLAEWFNDMYNLDLTADNFLEKLESGIVLCQHANNVHKAAIEFRKSLGENSPKNGLQIPEKEIRYKPLAPPGTFMARDNISNFIYWCRHSLGVKDVLLFETDDLVLRKNEKSFVLCLLELARRGAKFGMEAPMIIQMEREIEAEIAGEEPPIKFVQKKTCDVMSLDEMVRDLISRCSCPVQFPMVRISDGKYRIGDSSTLIFVRILRSHVMVRVGGGWDTLEHYLDKHDPCRCAVHKAARLQDTTIVRRPSSPNVSSYNSKPRMSQEINKNNNKLHHRFHSTGNVNMQNGDSNTRRTSRENDYSKNRAPSPSLSSTTPMRKSGSTGRLSHRDDNLRSSADGPLLRQSVENARRSSNGSLNHSPESSARSSRYASMNGDADRGDNSSARPQTPTRAPRPASPRTSSSQDIRRRGRAASPGPNRSMNHDDSFYNNRVTESPRRGRPTSPAPNKYMNNNDDNDYHSPENYSRRRGRPTSPAPNKYTNNDDNYYSPENDSRRRGRPTSPAPNKYTNDDDNYYSPNNDSRRRGRPTSPAPNKYTNDDDNYYSPNNDSRRRGRPTSLAPNKYMNNDDDGGGGGGDYSPEDDSRKRGRPTSSAPNKYMINHDDNDDDDYTSLVTENPAQPTSTGAETHLQEGDVNTDDWEIPQESSRQTYMTHREITSSSQTRGEHQRRGRAKSPGPKAFHPDSSDSASDTSSSRKSGGHSCQPTGTDWNNSTRLDHPSYDISGNNRMSTFPKRGEGRSLPDTPAPMRSSGRSSPSPIAEYIRSGRSSPSPVLRSSRTGLLEVSQESEHPHPRSTGRSSPRPFEREAERPTSRTGRSSPVPTRSRSVPPNRDRSSTPARSATPTSTRTGSSLIDREKERKERMRARATSPAPTPTRSGRASPSFIERPRATSPAPSRARSSGRSSPAPRSTEPTQTREFSRVSKPQKDDVVFVISRTDGGGHRVLKSENSHQKQASTQPGRSRERETPTERPSSRISSRRTREQEDREIARRRCRSVSPERARRREMEDSLRSDRNQIRYRSKTPEPRDFERRQARSRDYGADGSSSSYNQRDRGKQRLHDAMKRFIGGSKKGQLDAYDSDDEADDSSNSSDQRRARVTFNEGLNRSIRHSALRPCSPVPSFHKLEPKFYLPKRVDPFPDSPTKIPVPIFHHGGNKTGHQTTPRASVGSSLSSLSKLRNRAADKNRTRSASNPSLSSNTSNNTTYEFEGNVRSSHEERSVERSDSNNGDSKTEVTIVEDNKTEFEQHKAPEKSNEIPDSFAHGTLTRSTSQDSADVFYDEKPSPTTNGYGMDSGFEDFFNHYSSTSSHHSPERKQPPINKMAAPLVTGRSTIIRSSSTSSTGTTSNERPPIRPVTPTLERANFKEMGVYDSDSTDTEYF